jgi:hypothetical protein
MRYPGDGTQKFIYVYIFHTIFSGHLPYNCKVRCGIFHMWCYIGGQEVSDFVAFCISDF